MSKIKYPAAVLLSLFVVAAGALLPSLVSALSDQPSESIALRDMSTVKLDIESEKDTLSTAEKLFLLGSGVFIDIDSYNASRTKDDILAFAQKNLEPYFEAGLLPGSIDDYHMDAGARLGYYHYDADLNMIVWAVLIESKMGVCIDLIVDDETGTILYINVNSAEGPLTEVYNDFGYIGDAFTQIYFSQLGIQPVLYDAVSANEFVITDETYGELIITLAVHYGGFRVAISLQDAERMQNSTE